MTTTTDRPLLTMTQVRQAMQARGSHFFDRDTMRGFSSRVSETVYPTAAGTYFVTSERDRGCYISSGWIEGAWNGQRRYTIRFCAARAGTHDSHGHTWPHERGELVSITDDDFGAYRSRSDAHAAARRLQAANGGYPASGV
jgi:hypothetical protein